MSINADVHLWRGDAPTVSSGNKMADAGSCWVSIQTFTEDGWPAGQLSLNFRKPADMAELADRIAREAMRLQEQREFTQHSDHCREVNAMADHVTDTSSSCTADCPMANVPF